MAYIIMSDTFEKLCEIRKFKSILWHELYLATDGSGGDFKMEISADKYLKFIKKNYYIINTESVYGKFGIIDTFQVQENEEDGSIVTVSGSMGESILQRRIIFPQLSMSGPLDDIVATIIARNVTEPANHSRKIENFTYIRNPAFNEYLSKQITGANVGTALVSICGRFGHSYVVRFNADYTGFEMELITGTDRSASQSDNPIIKFSADDFGLTEFTYLTSNKSVFTHVICAGEGYGESRPSVTYPSFSTSSTTGINRREVFLDRQNLSRDQGDDSMMSEFSYREKLENEAFEKLQESSTSEACEGIIKPYRYKLYEDFWVGDIVSVENEKFSMGYDIRVLGALISIDENGAQDITAEMGNLVVQDLSDDEEEPEEDVVEEEDDTETSIKFPSIDTPSISLGDSVIPFTFSGGTVSKAAKGAPNGWLHIIGNGNAEVVLSASARYCSGEATMGTISFNLNTKQNSGLGNVLAADLSGAIFPVVVVAGGASTMGTLTLGRVTNNAGAFSIPTTLDIGSPSGEYALLMNCIRLVYFDGESNPVAYLENPDTVVDSRKENYPYWLIIKETFSTSGSWIGTAIDTANDGVAGSYQYSCFFFSEIPTVNIYSETSFGSKYLCVETSEMNGGSYTTTKAGSQTAETLLYDWEISGVFGGTGTYLYRPAWKGPSVPFEVVGANFDVYGSDGLILAKNPEKVGCLR